MLWAHPTSFQGQGPLYTMVEKCIGRSRILAQDMVIWGEGWYVEKMKRQLLKKIEPLGAKGPCWWEKKSARKTLAK
jgi:hypothetical protein